MTDEARPRSPDPRFATWIGATVVLFLASIAVGFIWLPSAQQGSGARDLWSAICRAVGWPGTSGAASSPAAGQPSSTIAWTVATRRLMMRGDGARGATLATNCNNCHGANGISTDAAIPNLAGHSVAAIYKQLEDYKSGKRNPAVMGVFVAPLSKDQMLDLATHFASLPNPSANAVSLAGTADPGARNLIEVGSPLRGIASCAACHGPMGFTSGAPDLRGQQRAYLEEQMQAFKAGKRHNDISEQMRSVARELTSEEIANLAAYYYRFAATVQIKQ
jgi:cytochrome c553